MKSESFPRIKPVVRHEAKKEVREILDRIEEHFGMLPNLFATIAQYPKALKPLFDLYRALCVEASIDPRLQELAILKVSQVNSCPYCISHHTKMAQGLGISQEELDSLENYEKWDNFSPRERAVIEYAEYVTLDAERVPDELFERLQSFFPEREIVNLTLIIGLFNLFTRVNGAIQVELEDKKGGF